MTMTLTSSPVISFKNGTLLRSYSPFPLPPSLSLPLFPSFFASPSFLSPLSLPSFSFLLAYSYGLLPSRSRSSSLFPDSPFLLPHSPSYFPFPPLFFTSSFLLILLG